MLLDFGLAQLLYCLSAIELGLANLSRARHPESLARRSVSRDTDVLCCVDGQGLNESTTGELHFMAPSMVIVALLIDLR